ncbi:hypothetical protein AMECASPLE_002348 [Ameca splendens]|uniref:Uncharacterized protein n=1 Tax=Ameca splendens TaxID=208324 RepID=A0ABV0YLH3_9TELE
MASMGDKVESSGRSVFRYTWCKTNTASYLQRKISQSPKIWTPGGPNRWGHRRLNWLALNSEQSLSCSLYAKLSWSLLGTVVGKQLKLIICSPFGGLPLLDYSSRSHWAQPLVGQTFCHSGPSGDPTQACWLGTEQTAVMIHIQSSFID